MLRSESARAQPAPAITCIGDHPVEKRSTPVGEATIGGENDCAFRASQGPRRWEVV
jgi:hypothetical protein